MKSNQNTRKTDEGNIVKGKIFDPENIISSCINQVRKRHSAASGRDKADAVVSCYVEG